MIAAAMRIAHSAAAATGLGEHHHEHAACWADALDAWQTGAVRLPGPDDPVLRTHTRALLTSLDQTVAAYQGGPATSPLAEQQRHELGQFLQHQGPSIELAYQQRVTSLVDSSRVDHRRPSLATPHGPTRAGGPGPSRPGRTMGAAATDRAAGHPDPGGDRCDPPHREHRPAERVDLSALRAKLTELHQDHGAAGRHDRTYGDPVHHGPTQW